MILDPRFDAMRLRFAVAITVVAALVAYVVLLDNVASKRSAAEQAARDADRVTSAAPPSPESGRPRIELAASTPPRNSYAETAAQAAWAAGTFRGAKAADGWLRLASRAGTARVAGKTFEWAAWQSPWVTPGHEFTELIPSWKAATPAGTFISVQARARTSTGRMTAWRNFGRWTVANNAAFRRSLGTQADGLSTVQADTVRADPGVSFTGYTLKVRVFRRAGTSATPAVDTLGAVASQFASGALPTSTPLLGAQELAVPAYSQMTHRGQYPQYGGGGQAWCSPTSLSMVLAYFGARPTPREYSWVNKSYADPWVDEVARRVFDHEYDGAGNWPFNTAYAAGRLAQAAVLRLDSLRDIERFIANGVPVIVSVAFSPGQLSGAPIRSTAGHLLVVRGFTATGDVLVNDPAAPDNGSVARTYKRSEFEAVWQQKSHGAAYVVRDGDHAFPTGYGLS